MLIYSTWALYCQHFSLLEQDVPTIVVGYGCGVQLRRGRGGVYGTQILPCIIKTSSSL